MFKYIKLADFLQTLIHKKLQIKDVIYSQQNSNLRNKKNTMKINVDPRVAYSNLSLILNNLHKFEQMYNKLHGIMRQRQQKVIGNKYLLFVMVAQFLNVGKIVGGGKIKKIIMQNISILPEIQVQSKINKQIINIRLRKCVEQHNKQQYSKWKILLEQFGKEDSTVPNLYNVTQIQYSKLVTKQPTIRTTPVCVIQSFSSNLPPFLLFQGLNNANNEERKFDIIDACSAPGNKTLQLSQYLGHRGNVYAFEKDQRRYKTLCKNIVRYQTKNIITLNQNFLQSLPQNYNKVKLILLDPSCSGSGMLTNFTRDNNQNKQDNYQSVNFEQYVARSYQKLSIQQKQRVQLLKKFQIQLLNHSAKFNPQRISYSTCSIYCQQNQQVVQQFLKDNPSYCIKPVYKNLNPHKSLVGGFGKQYKNCIRVDPRLKISDGFFVCVFGKVK